MKTTARLLLSALALVLTVLTPSAEVWAQKTGKVYRLGWVSFGNTPPAGVGVQYPAGEALIRRLAERGYIEGKNLVIDYRWAEADYQRVAPLSGDLVRSGADVIFTAGTKMGRIVQEAVKNTPLVVYSCDPFEHVARLARQGGNVTGVTCMTTELSPKRLELLKEAMPKASRVVFLYDPDDAPLGLKLTQEAAPRLGIKLSTVAFHARADMPGALDAVAKERPDAVFVYPDVISFLERKQIGEFVLKQRLPTMNAFRDFVDAGGLMSYGSNTAENYALAGDQIAQILNGVRPGDLPVLQPTKFELVINLKTAKALGLTIPPSVLLRADHVIE
jgi:putative tryptophan/tyrosine transport system substrate-binding protein